MLQTTTSRRKQSDAVFRATADPTRREIMRLLRGARHPGDALTDPDQRIKWWGSEGRFQATHMESELRPGGRWMMQGIGMGGRPFQVVGTYRDIERPRLLVSTWLPDWQGDATESVVRFDLDE